MDICKELRKLAQSVPQDETVLLPATQPSKWVDDNVEFEPVKIAGLLQFIADMIE